jgi:hypothetical protein
MRPTSVFHRIPFVVNLIPLTAVVIFLFFPKHYTHFAISMCFYALYELIFGKKTEEITKSTFSERKLSVPFYYGIFFISLFYAVCHYVFADCTSVNFPGLFAYMLNAVIFDIKLMSLNKNKK